MDISFPIQSQIRLSLKVFSLVVLKNHQFCTYGKLSHQKKLFVNWSCPHIKIVSWPIRLHFVFDIKKKKDVLNRTFLTFWFWHSSRSLFRWLTGTTIVDRYFHYSFLFSFLPLFSVTTFSQRRSARIKFFAFLQKLMGVPKNLGVHPFPDPIGHFGASWQPFWMFEVLIEGMIESKNLFSKRWSEGPID